MKTILSLLIFVVLLFWIGQIFFSDKKKFRAVEYGRGEYYLLSRNMYFVIFTVCTAPVFLSSLSLLKYGLWFMVVLVLLFMGKVRMKFDIMTAMYSIFFFWLCYTMTYSTVPRDGTMMLVKYLLPLLFLWLGYSGLGNEKDLIIFLKVVNVVACIYCLIMGGFAATFIPPLYYFVAGVLSTYAAFADFLTAVFIVPILLYWLTKENKYIYCALWMVLSTVLQSVRTGMGGMLLVFLLALLLRYKIKALPGVVFAGAFFLGVVLFVPQVNEKFFGENAGTISATDIVQGGAMRMDKIEMSGREGIWEKTKEACYYGNEVMGSGLGVTGHYVKYDIVFKGGRQGGKLHNDYLELICDTGLIGILLLTIFYVVVVLKVSIHVLRRSSLLVKLTGIMALSSMAGVGFCMYFDNVVSNSMQSMVIPYIYLGFFLKALDWESNAIAQNIKERNSDYR